jgi:four helix bundle protein
MKVKSFQDLKIWREAHQLTVVVYDITRGFPQDERYALVSQLRRAASSIPSNIAEGTGRRTLKDLINFLYMARGSAQEARYHLILSADLGYLSKERVNRLENRYNGPAAGIYRCIQSLQGRIGKSPES